MARNHALEQAIAEDPQAIEPYLVYADWLKQQGDPRGDLIGIQIALEQAQDEISEALYRRREETLLQMHSAALFGPAAPFEPQLLRGFVHHVHVRNPIDQRAALVELLSSDHAATCFLKTMAAPAEHRERLRKQITESGRAITVLEAVDAIVTCKAFGERFAISTEIRSPDRDPKKNKKADAGRCSSLWRITVDTAAGRSRWWYGDREASMTKLSSGMGWLARFEGEAHVHIMGRMRTLDRQGILWIEENATFTAADGSSPLSIRPCEASTGTPFELSPLLEVELSSGPALLSRSHNALGAVLPGLGVYVPHGSLLTEEGEVALPPLPEPRGRCSVGPSYGGPNGALCATRVPPRGGCWLLLARLPRGEVRTVFLKQPPQVALFDATGARFAALTRHVVGRTEGPRPTDILQYQVSVVGTDTGTVISRTIISKPIHPDSVLLWVGDTVYLYSEGTSFEISALGGTFTSMPAPRPPGRALSFVNNAAGRAVHHPIPDRAARLICAEPPGENEPGTSIVIWTDGDGQQGGVSIPDDGWADCGMFGRLSVLEDGSIVAVGRRVWWIDPAAGTASDLGPAGYYGELLTITWSGARRRLWSQGPGAWWLEIPP